MGEPLKARVIDELRPKNKTPKIGPKKKKVKAKDKAKAKAHLNCPGEAAFETAVTVLKVNEAVESQQTLKFNSDEFKI